MVMMMTVSMLFSSSTVDCRFHVSSSYISRLLSVAHPRTIYCCYGGFHRDIRILTTTCIFLFKVRNYWKILQLHQLFKFFQVFPKTALGSCGCFCCCWWWWWRMVASAAAATAAVVATTSDAEILQIYLWNSNKTLRRRTHEGKT